MQSPFVMQSPFLAAWNSQIGQTESTVIAECGEAAFVSDGPSSYGEVTDLPSQPTSDEPQQQGVLFESLSRILAVDYNNPSFLQPRPSCDLNLQADDILASDEILGRGAWGTVCRGMYLKKFEDAAIKYIHWSGEPYELQSLQRELTVLARLKHPNILTMYGGNVWPKPEIFLVQELMCGSVSDVMYGKKGSGETGRKLELMEALRISRDVLKGLCYLHQHLVVHRDIKPDNILLNEDGVAKIGDFGLARFKINTMLQTRTLDMGTAAYMAPECFDSDLGGVSVAVDIYSFGITLWELMMCERPYKEFGIDQAIMWQVMHAKRPPMPEASPAFPAKLQALIQTCWAQHPQHRPNACQVLAEVEAMIAGDWEISSPAVYRDPPSPSIRSPKPKSTSFKRGVADALFAKLSLKQ